MKQLLWSLFFLLAAYMGYQGAIISRSTPQHYNLFDLEYADAATGKQIFAVWQDITYGPGTMLGTAQSNTRTDFLFIADYTLLILLLSYLQMQRERNGFLNRLLRLNLLLALLVAALDSTENTLILYNIRHFQEAGRYWCPCYVSTAKWILSAWAVLVWLTSLANLLINGKKKHQSSYTVPPEPQAT